MWSYVQLRKFQFYPRIWSHVMFSLRSSRFLSFSRRRSNKRRAKEHAWGEHALGEVGRGGLEGVGGGEKRNRLQSFPNILPNSVCPQTGSNSAIWLVITRQSKYNIWNSSFMHNPTSGIQQDQNWYDRVWSSFPRGLRIFCLANVERPFRKTLDSSSENQSKKLP